MSVDRKLVRRDFSDHNQHEGLRYDVLAKGKDSYERDTVIGKAKFQPHRQFNNGVRGMDVVHFMEKVIEDSEVYLFDEEQLNETEEKALRIQKEIENQLQKRRELLETLPDNSLNSGTGENE